MDRILMTEIEESLEILNSFFGDNPTKKIGELNKSLAASDRTQINQLLSEEKIGRNLIHSAYLIKKISAQIDTKLHCLGIIYLLNKLLDEDEIIESLALGSDNQSEFDLVTNHRIAEFKFGEWKGKDSMRRKKLFQDYFNLAESSSSKRKILYVYELDPVLKFLQSSSDFSNILDKEESLRIAFRKKYGNSLTFVKEYYAIKDRLVEIIEFKELLNN
ncbi:MAG: hypothetical protein IPH97_06360 [Ignavibacteriales bacterium]|nr:hypothetical protein [Ignavibacteriales bacterium]